MSRLPREYPRDIYPRPTDRSFVASLSLRGRFSVRLLCATPSILQARRGSVKTRRVVNTSLIRHGTFYVLPVFPLARPPIIAPIGRSYLHPKREIARAYKLYTGLRYLPGCVSTNASDLPRSERLSHGIDRVLFLDHRRKNLAVSDAKRHRLRGFTCKVAATASISTRSSDVASVADRHR